MQTLGIVPARSGSCGKDAGRTSSGHCDPDQPTFSPCRRHLASDTGDWDLRRGRFPLVLGAEPRDRLFVWLDLGGRTLDGAGVHDRAESGARGVVVESVRRIGGGREWVGAGNGNERDVDLHGLGVGVCGSARACRRIRPAQTKRRKSRRRGQRLREGERGALMASFAITQHAREMAGIKRGRIATGRPARLQRPRAPGEFRGRHLRDRSQPGSITRS
jgi:hypothetical protein